MRILFLDREWEDGENELVIREWVKPLVVSGNDVYVVKSLEDLRQQRRLGLEDVHVLIAQAREIDPNKLYAQLERRKDFRVFVYGAPQGNPGQPDLMDKPGVKYLDVFTPPERLLALMHGARA